MSVVYKVVKNVNERYFSAIVTDEGWRLEYEIDKEVSAPHGYVFAFYNLGMAKDWMWTCISFHDTVILECDAEIEVFAPSLMAYDCRPETMALFWEDDPDVPVSQQIPMGTVWCSTLTPRKVVMEQPRKIGWRVE